MISCGGAIGKDLDNYVTFVDLIIIVILLGCCGISQSQSCPTVYSEVDTDGEKIKVAWKTRHGSHDSVVISEPPCLDSDKQLVFRICANGTWLPSRDCHHVDSNSFCPPGYKEKKGKCIYVTVPQKWEDKCPYPDASTEVKNHNNIWLPFQQKVKYGSFEYTLPDERYGLPYSETDLWEDSDEILSETSGCVAKMAGKVQNVSCNETFSRVCLYRYNSFLYKCPYGCVPGGLGTNYCFCKRSSHISCELASLKYPYEKNILHKLVGNDVCLLGNLQMHGDHDLAIGKNSLYLERPGDANCAVCKIKPSTFGDVDLDLTFNAKSYKLYLNIYSPEGLHKMDDRIQVFCFTDATDKLKYRVNVKEEFDSQSTSLNNLKYKVFKVQLVENGPGYYWCEAFLLPAMNVITSNKVLAYKKIKYNEYSLRLQIQDLCIFSRTDCKLPNEDFISGVCKSLFKPNVFAKFVKAARLFRIYEINDIENTADVLVHLSVKSPLSDKDEYDMVKNTLKLLAEQNVTIISLESSSKCFSHVTNNGSILHWDSTIVGTIAVPKEICVRDDGTPITRRCLGDFYLGSHWEEITETCSKIYNVSSKTALLSSLAQSHSSSTDSSISLTDITANMSDFTVLDMHYLSKTLARTTSTSPSSEIFITYVSQIINNLMHSNSSTLRSSQQMLNTTDEFLDTFESKLSSAHFTNNSILLVNSDIIVHATKPFLNNVSGISVRGLSDAGHFLNSTVTELFSNTTLGNLVSEADLEIAVYVPEKLLNILFANQSQTNLKDIMVITTIYYSDKFFNSDTNSEEIVGSKIVSVTISNRGDYLQEPIPIIFRARNNSGENMCAFWNYGLRSANRYGHWSTLGGTKLQENNGEWEHCLFSHLTNFALLIKIRHDLDDTGTHQITKIVEEVHDNILSVISSIGGAFSILGVCGIFLTAILFKTWRKKVGTKILMNLCVALFLQVIFLNLATDELSMKSSGALCIVTGIILHFVTIAEFAWMLVAAGLQFYRFVQVVGPMPNRLILKASLIGWGFPLIPITLTCVIDIDSYSASSDGICYPTGLAKYLGVFLPVTFIVVSNMVIFFMILRNIFYLKLEPKGGTVLKRQICLTILLFFLLGIPWMFGVLAEIIQDTWLSYMFLYIFCFTATIQGFVLFIFYVILDNSTRILWVEWIQKLREKYN